MRRKKPKQIEYYMHHEIFQQIEVLSSLFEEHVDYEKRQIRFSEKSMIGKLKKIKRYVFLGLGSSAHAAMMGNYYFEEIAMINAEFEFADEFVSRRAILEPHTAVVVLSQSGKSKDAISAAKIAKDKGAVLISVSNTQGSALDRLADLRFNTNAGEEKGVAATKSFSSQLMILFLLSLYILQMKNEKLVLRRKWIDELRKTPEYLKEVL
ncbi:hypothetical protein C0583_07130 [Candidatus Parcubacteria bacterium]|nr:MAG: hypothetical protein C0583_07130 [Candidatus Parcubacteria bacterium]